MATVEIFGKTYKLSNAGILILSLEEYNYLAVHNEFTQHMEHLLMMFDLEQGLKALLRVLRVFHGLEIIQNIEVWDNVESPTAPPGIAKIVGIVSIDFGGS